MKVFDHNSIIFDFMLNNLNDDGLEEYDSFNNKTGYFKVVYAKEIKHPLVFWNLTKIKYPNLARLATRLLKIPASSAQIERIFSSCADVHSCARNKLLFERSKQLVHINYSLRVKDVSEEDDNE